MTVVPDHAPTEAGDGTQVVVGVGGLLVARHPDTLLTRALGSCVGLTMWDPAKRIGGMAHVLLPDVAGGRADRDPRRVATTAVPLLVSLLVDAGCEVRRLEVKLAGGAAMFPVEGGGEGIGARNTAEVRRQLALLGLAPKAEDVGGSHARTIELYLDTGVLRVRSYVHGLREI
jgi:chemotaxis protein CheD